MQKLRCDMGIHRNGRKGTLNAPEALLDELEFDEAVFVDEVFPDEFDLEETHRRIRENTEELAGYGAPVFSLGGDHSVSYPAVSALKDEHPGLQLVWLDSHPDVKEKVDGNVSHDVVVRQLVEDGFEGEDIWIVGASRIDADEEDFIEGSELNFYGPEEVDEFLEEFDPGEEPIYLSLDIDAIESLEGTGYPDGELSMEDVERVIEISAPEFADLVEVAPPLDTGETVESGRELVQKLATVLKSGHQTSP